MPRNFGHIPGQLPGTQFGYRRDLSQAWVHRPTQAGISGSASEAADSIVVSGGYEDDQDYGDVIIYTGEGGNDRQTGRQVEDQELIRGNMGLALSHDRGRPVRVIRGANNESRYAPSRGYRYDGLYRVDAYWSERGRSGFNVWRFRLVAIPGQVNPAVLPGNAAAPMGNVAPAGGNGGPAPRAEATVVRIVRDTAQSRRVKTLYNYTCQICGTRLSGPAGPYAEGAHIRALGSPHDGPDTLDNLLCLCPNHHVLLDLGAIAVGDDLRVIGTNTKLTVHPQHRINVAHLKYHREHRQSPALT